MLLSDLVAQRYDWSAPIRLPQLWEPLCGSDDRVTFGMVVAARQHVWAGGPLQAEALTLARLLREKFEEQQGAIQNSYFCRYARGGCAVTERVTGSGKHQRVTRRLHSALNSNMPQLVAMETGCAVLADDAVAAFAQQPDSTGHLRVATDRIFSVLTRVMVAADVWTKPSATAEERTSAIEAAYSEYAVTRRNVNVAIQRQARFVYFQGVLLGAVAAITACALIGAVDARYWSHIIGPAELMGATVFGALGALASVFQRMSTGKLVLDFSASRGQLVTLGGLRPFVGALFGAIVQFVLVSALLGASPNGRPAETVFATFAIIGFAAGFSERFATDMIERAGSVIAGTATSNGTGRSGRATDDQPAGQPTGREASPFPTDRPVVPDAPTWPAEWPRPNASASGSTASQPVPGQRPSDDPEVRVPPSEAMAAVEAAAAPGMSTSSGPAPTAHPEPGPEQPEPGPERPEPGSERPRRRAERPEPGSERPKRRAERPAQKPGDQ